MSTTDKMIRISEGNGFVLACGTLSDIKDTRRDFVIQLLTSDDTGRVHFVSLSVCINHESESSCMRAMIK